MYPPVHVKEFRKRGTADRRAEGAAWGLFLKEIRFEEEAV